MKANLSFFICSFTVLVLAILNLNFSPIYNGRTEFWNLQDCSKISYLLEKYRKDGKGQERIDKMEIVLDHCNIKKPLYNLEQAAFVTNVCIGFICIILFLLFLEKKSKKILGLIGIPIGIAGTGITFAYVVLNGIVYTNYYEMENKIYKIDEKGAFAEKSGDNYKCLFFTKVNDTQALIAKFSDLMQSKYNYDKKMKEIFSNNNNEQYYCNERSPSDCARNGYIEGPKTYIKDGTKYECKYLYYYKFYDYENYDLSMRFLICLILSIFSILCYCVLVFSGFWLLKELPDDTDDILSKSSLSENFNE